MNNNLITQQCIADLKTIYNKYKSTSSFIAWCKTICGYKILPDGTTTNIFWDNARKIPKNPDIELTKAMQKSNNVHNQALTVILKAYFAYLSICKTENKPPMPLDAWIDLIIHLAYNNDNANENSVENYKETYASYN